MDGFGLRFGPYRAERLLGRGGMGQVYLARDHDGRPAAVKVVHSFLARDPEFRARFRREVAAAGAVDSPRTAALLAADPETERPWLASAYVEGPTLTTLVRAHGALDEHKLRALAAALATALGAIHAAGLVHRDLKPSNVIIGRDGPCVIDFGIARAADSTRLTGTGMLLGTAGWAAPEQLTDGVSAPAGDLFSLGAVLATAATGRRPFGAGPPHVAAYRTVHAEPDLAGVPEELLPLIAACLQKDPARRPPLSAVLAAGPAEEVSWADEAEVREEPGAENDPAPGPQVSGGAGEFGPTPTGAAPAAPPEGADRVCAASLGRSATAKGVGAVLRGRGRRPRGLPGRRRHRHPYRRAALAAERRRAVDAGGRDRHVRWEPRRGREGRAARP